MDENEAMEVNSSDDSSSSDDEDKVLLAKAEELERQISDNKYLYDAHLELVKLYKQLSDLESMRQAYERFSDTFPLTSQIWLEWINTEKTLITTEGESSRINSLFERATNDYLSVELWVEYAQYSIGANSLEKTREILAQGLNACAVHVGQGILLWDTLREFELAHLSLYQQSTEEHAEQLKKVVNVFKRELQVPLVGMEGTYNEWLEFHKLFPDVPDTKFIQSDYEAALKKLKIYVEFEDRLRATNVESELYEIYKEYVGKVDDPSTALCLYERAVAQMCLNPNIWHDYITYAMKLGGLADKISKKALRNCTWTVDIWVYRLRVLEDLKQETQKILECFEEALLVCGAANQDLWLAYLEYYNRNQNEERTREKLYKLFDQAIEQVGYHNDANLKIVKFYARISGQHGDTSTGRKLWKNILKGPQNRSSATVWLEYVNFERLFGDKSKVREVLERALSNVTDWPHCIVDEWMMFEREFGNLTDMLKCAEKCKGKELVCDANELKQNEQKGKKRKFSEAVSGQVETKRVKIEDGKTDFLKPKPKIVRDPKTTVFISNLYPSINEKRLKKVFPNSVNIELVMDKQGKSRCYGYVQFELEEEVMTALARDRELLDNRPMFISNCKPDRNERKASFKYSDEVESNKLFVKGLPVSKTQEDVEGIFKEHGAISVRLVVHKSGQSKGLAYVEFATDEAAQKAMKATDKMKIAGHTISVAISSPPVKNTAKSGEPTPTHSRHSRSRLQIPLIPRSLQVKKPEAGASSNGASTPAKSNEDFRKLLFNK